VGHCTPWACPRSRLKKQTRPDCIAGSGRSPLYSLSNSNGPKQEHSQQTGSSVSGLGRSTRDDDDVTQYSYSRGSQGSGRGRRRPDGPKQNKQLTKGRCRGGAPARPVVFYSSSSGLPMLDSGPVVPSRPAVWPGRLPVAVMVNEDVRVEVLDCTP